MKTIYIIAMALLVLLVAGCSVQKISEIKNADHVGSDVTVSGTVSKTIKIGDLSGYTLTDETGDIGVSVARLPAEGDKITVSGVLIKDTIFGYYIKVKE